MKNDSEIGEEKHPTPKERNNLDLLVLVCELHSRALNYGTEELHRAYWEARNELESRLAAQQSPAAVGGITYKDFYEAIFDIDYGKDTSQDQARLEAAKACYDLALRMRPQQTGIQWVKCSERLPEIKKTCQIVYRDIEKNVGTFMAHPNRKFEVSDYFFEWLDERAPISGAATGRDWEGIEKALDVAQMEIRAMYKKEGFNSSNVLDIVDMALITVQGLRSSLPSAQGQFSEEDMRKCWDAARSIEDDLIRKGEFDDYLKQLHPLPDPKP